MGEIREQFEDQLNQFSAERQLWRYFLALMGRIIRHMKTLSEDGISQLIRTLNPEFKQFFQGIFQLDAASMQLEHDPAIRF